MSRSTPTIHDFSIYFIFFLILQYLKTLSSQVLVKVFVEDAIEKIICFLPTFLYVRKGKVGWSSKWAKIGRKLQVHTILQKVLKNQIGIRYFQCFREEAIDVFLPYTISVNVIHNDVISFVFKMVRLRKEEYQPYPFEDHERIILFFFFI